MTKEYYILRPDNVNRTGRKNMAKQIEIGLELHGQDALDFYEYLENPTYTQAAIDCMKAAMALPGRKTE